MRARISVLFVTVAAIWACGGSTSTPGGGDASTESGSSASGSSSGSNSSSSSGASSSTSSGSGGGNCPTCNNGLSCCNGVDCSVDELNDPTNCGSCSHHCVAPASFCSNGMCSMPPCQAGGCGAGTTCCGRSCCTSGQICCQAEGGAQTGPSCYTPTAMQPTCPPGCPLCVSDRNVKRDIVPVDPQAVLDRLASIPVSTWSYKSDDPSVRHMGPMAQDFYAGFSLGATDKAYSPVDATGVTFAAIQALYDHMRDQDARIEKLERENRELRRAKK
jgi:hypothetical protein